MRFDASLVIGLVAQRASLFRVRPNGGATFSLAGRRLAVVIRSKEVSKSSQLLHFT